MFERRQRPLDYETRYIRFEFFRNLFALAAGGAVLVGAIWLLPRVVFTSDDETEGPALTAPEEDEVEEVVFVGSGRYQPTTLSIEHEWIGSREETTAPDLAEIDARVVLATRGSSGALDPAFVVEVSAVGSLVPREFDPAQGLPFEQQEVGERTFLVSQAEGDPVQRVAWTEPSGRQVWVSARGLSLDAVLDLASGITIFDPVVAAEEAAAAAAEAGETTDEDAPPTTLSPEGSVPQVLFSSRGGLDLLLETPVEQGEIISVRDNFAVPGRAEGAVSITHLTGAGEFDPLLEAALSPTARLVRLRDTDAVVDAGVRWRENEDLVIEIEGQGYTDRELVEIAERLVEISEDALNERRPPIAEIRVVDTATPAPEPQFDTGALGNRVELSNAVESAPPFPAGQLVGPVVAVGRLEGTEIDVFAWQRGDGQFRECVGLVGPGVEQVLCLTDDDAVNGPVRVGVAPIDAGLFIGGRLHVYRVPGRVSVVSAIVAGEAVQQRPIEGIVVFLARDFADIRVTAFEADSTEVLAVG
ncbi:MAG: hypothetical protein AAGD18_02595 [Actinomycetota bacterium]